MKSKSIFFIILCLFFCFSLLAQKKDGYSKKYVIINLDGNTNDLIGTTFCKTQDLNKKEIYILNLRYKLDSDRKSKIGLDADFMWAFYIIPKDSGIKIIEIKEPHSILNNTVENISKVKEYLLKTEAIDFKPIIALGGKYFMFTDADIIGQAFNLKEYAQYFPQYGLFKPNIYELNFLCKPYTEQNILNLEKEVIKDTTGLTHFDYDGFRDKWNINKINKTDKTIDFWIRLTTLATGSYSFGRFATEIRFKINVGITDFSVYPLMPVFSEKYFKDNAPVQFKFKEFVNLKELVK